MSDKSPARQDRSRRLADPRLETQAFLANTKMALEAMSRTVLTRDLFAKEHKPIESRAAPEQTPSATKSGERTKIP
jgi:hypothetical protein